MGFIIHVELYTVILKKLRALWISFWMRHAGLSTTGRVANWLAALATPPYYGRLILAGRRGFISPRATIHHSDFHLSNKVYIDDRVLIYQDKDGGLVELAEGVHLHRDTIIQTGFGGTCTIGAHTHVQPRCQFSAYKAPIRIGCHVNIAPNCAFYSFDHGIAPGQRIIMQPLTTKGAIIIDDDVWVGVGVIVLSGVRIGKGAVIGAGAVVTQDIPDGAIVVGVPARVVKMREDLS